MGTAVQAVAMGDILGNEQAALAEIDEIWGTNFAPKVDWEYIADATSIYNLGSSKVERRKGLDMLLQKGFTLAECAREFDADVRDLACMLGQGMPLFDYDLAEQILVAESMLRGRQHSHSQIADQVGRDRYWVMKLAKNFGDVTSTATEQLRNGGGLVVTPAQMDVIQAMRIDGASPAQIATQLDISVNTVKSIVRRRGWKPSEAAKARRRAQVSA